MLNRRGRALFFVVDDSGFRTTAGVHVIPIDPHAISNGHTDCLFTTDPRGLEAIATGGVEK